MNSQKVNLQVIIEEDLRDKAEIKALEDGFDSLPALIRFWLNEYEKDKLVTKVTNIIDDEILTNQQEQVLIRKLLNLLEEEQKGTAKIAKSSKDLFKQLGVYDKPSNPKE